MKLAYWMYAGPAHIGTLRVASSFKNVHAIMHAPLGDDYFNVMRSMLERERDFTPVTASIVDRHVLARGSQEKVVENIQRKDKEESPDLILLTPTCTSSILQEDLQNFVNRASNESSSDVLLADVNHYRVNELQAADRTLEQIVRFYIEKDRAKVRSEENFNDFSSLTPSTRQEKFSEKIFPPSQVASEPAGISVASTPKKIESSTPTKTNKPSANILGMFTLGFHNQHDCKELKRLLSDLGITVNEIIPEGGFVTQLKNLPKAWFNIVPYREVGLMTASYLEREHSMPYTSITPMGIVDTSLFIREMASICHKIWNDLAPTLAPTLDPKSMDEIQALRILNKKDLENFIDQQSTFVSQAAWFSRSIDCQNLTGKKTVVFGDATHAASMTKILVREMGINVVCAGTYCKHDADWFREQVSGFCDQVLITDDHSQIGDIISQIEPAAIFGTQMERHVGKRLDIPCGVISAPVHIQNFPLGYRPFLGYEGTNQISDLVYNSFGLGMEDHLLEIFNGHDNKEVMTRSYSSDSSENEFSWNKEAHEELSRVPGFVRGKVKRNTEKYARSQKAPIITLEVMYAAKEAVAAN